MKSATACMLEIFEFFVYERAQISHFSIANMIWEGGYGTTVCTDCHQFKLTIRSIQLDKTIITRMPFTRTITIIFTACRSANMLGIKHLRTNGRSL